MRGSKLGKESNWSKASRAFRTYGILGAIFVSAWQSGSAEAGTSTTASKLTTSPKPMDEIVRDIFTRRKVSQVQEDMNILARALTQYPVDNNRYVESTDDPTRCAIGHATGGQRIPSFITVIPRPNAGTLTTPIQYLSNYPEDPFAAKGDSYGYFAPQPKVLKHHGWVLFSPGPDRKYDLDWKLFDPKNADPLEPLRASIYDPTNGTISAGDIVYVQR